MIQRTRVLLADDQRLVADGLRGILEPEYDVVGTVGDGRSLLAEARRLRPDVIILEVALPLLNGLEVARRLRDVSPEIKVIFVSMHSEVSWVHDAYEAGAAAYVLKKSPASVLRGTISDVLKGELSFFAKKPAAGSPEVASAGTNHELTTREREVLQLVAEGHSARQIAELLKISLKTVAFHKTNIKQKLDIRSTAELTKYAVRRGVAS